MFRQILNWRTVLALIAIFIISGTIFYSQYLASKIAKEEKQKVEQWIEAGKFLFSSAENEDVIGIQDYYSRIRLFQLLKQMKKIVFFSR